MNANLNSNLTTQEPRREKVFFKTFGCRTNIYDTELMKSYVKDYDIVSDENEADIVVVNSCTVTNSAYKRHKKARRQSDTNWLRRGEQGQGAV